MNIKEEVINLEVTFDELGRLLMPGYINVGFQVVGVDETELRLQISDTGEIAAVSAIVVKFKRERK